ncbi:MAG: hypothetical protein ACRDZZ_02100, partial [Ilumatobacteraceae bacterium]
MSTARVRSARTCTAAAMSLVLVSCGLRDGGFEEFGEDDVMFAIADTTTTTTTTTTTIPVPPSSLPGATTTTTTTTPIQTQPIE